MLHNINMLRSKNFTGYFTGVHVGDIGAKLGTNGNDNGYLALDNVRIPRQNMLSRFAKVREFCNIFNRSSSCHF